MLCLQFFHRPQLCRRKGKIPKNVRIMNFSRTSLVTCGTFLRHAFFVCLFIGLSLNISTRSIYGQGGCGSVCIPLEYLPSIQSRFLSSDHLASDLDTELEPFKMQVERFRLTAISEFADFNNFKVGDENSLNPGGTFVDFAPGFGLRIAKKVLMQTRFFVPIFEDWNGNIEQSVGQVTPNLTTQVSLSYFF